MLELSLERKYQLTYSVSSKVITALLYITLALFPVFFLPLTQEPLDLPKLYLLYGAVALMCAAFLVMIFFLPKMHLMRTIFDIPLAIIALFGLISPLLSLSKHVSMWGRPDAFIFHVSALIGWILWAWFFIQYIRRIKEWQAALAVAMGSAALVSLFFIFRGLPQFSLFQRLAFDNILATQNSNMSVFAAIFLVISVGMLGVSKQWWLKIIALVTGAIHALILLQLGFIMGWWVAVVGLFMLLTFAIIRWQKENLVYFLILFIIFITAFVFAIVESPAKFQRQLPAEIALGRSPSWQIAKKTLFNTGGSLFPGSGLGTFSYDFARFRDPSLNRTQLIEGVAFYAPLSSFFSMLTESGLAGTLLIFTLIVLIAGTLPLLVLNRIQPFLKGHLNVNLLDTKMENFRWQMAVMFAAWISLTFALFLAYFEVSLWWLWWLLFALLVVGFGILGMTRLARETVVPLSLPQPYGLVKSFAVMICLAGLVGVGVFMGRLYRADMLYVKAVAAPEFEQKEILLARAGTLRKGYAPYHIELSKLYVEQAAAVSRVEPIDTAQVVEYLGKSVEAARRAIDHEPNSFHAWENAGVIYFNAAPVVDGALEWAKDSFEKALALAPTHANIWWQQGNTYMQMKDIAKAEEHYKKAIELKPDFLAAHMSLATLYEGEGQLDRAIQVYRDVPPAGQQNADVLFNYGRLLYNRRKGDDAENAELLLKAAIELNPNFSNALFSLGILYEEQRDKAKALEYYQKVADLNPENKDIKAKIKSLRR